MKRSEINTILREAAEFVAASGFHLPPFAAWTPDECRAKRLQAPEVFDLGLGWDITDFGFGEFERRGLTLFTLLSARLRSVGYRWFAERPIPLFWQRRQPPLIPRRPECPGL